MIDLSEVVWKPKRDASLSSSWVSENSSRSDLLQVPVDEAKIEATSRLIVNTAPHSPGADRFRFLRMRLREARELTKVQSFLVTSPLPEEGKSVVSMNLATALAEEGKRRVLLIDADLHRPTMHEKLGLERRPGLAECLEDGLNLLSALRRIEPLQWYLLQAGSPRGNPAEALQPEALSDMMRVFSYHFDWIVIDTPPVLPLTDTLSVAQCVDTSLLVVKADVTPKEAVQEAIARLGPKHVLGIVLNSTERLNRVYSQYSSYYGKKKSR
jgi:capsular exopolysaccharide synthesis family protein